MPSDGFKPAIATIKKLQTYALDRRAIGISPYKKKQYVFKKKPNKTIHGHILNCSVVLTVLV